MATSESFPSPLFLPFPSADVSVPMAQASPMALKLKSVIGFGGGVTRGLVVLPNNTHVVYPLGSTVVVRHVFDAKADLRTLKGHTDRVTCVAVSPSGRYVASGQRTCPGAQAEIILWDATTWEVKFRLSLHKVSVRALSFSHDERYLASLGGDDDNRVAVWQTDTGKAICAAAATSRDQPALAIQFFSGDSTRLATAGAYDLRVWTIHSDAMKMEFAPCNLGSLRRVITCLYIDDNDQAVYAGTTSGDIVHVRTSTLLLKKNGPEEKKRFPKGVQAITPVMGGLLIGSGDGTVAIVDAESFRVVKSTKLSTGVTSLTSMIGPHLFVGTSDCTVYRMKLDDLSSKAVLFGHTSCVNDICFPFEYSQIFVTCSFGEIRVWNAETFEEHVRIKVPTVECTCVCVPKDGKTIVSGWGDGKIRAFGPQSGNLIYTINDAHPKGVTSITAAADCRRIISGGVEGSIRIWNVSKEAQRLAGEIKGHKGSINALVMSKSDRDVLSASNDGSCAVYDLEKLNRKAVVFAATQFRAVAFAVEEAQLLTTGTDRKIGYWEIVDGTEIRELEGSQQEIHALVVTKDEKYFATGGLDQLVRLWHYDEGLCKYVGEGHSKSVMKMAISPDQQTIVSVGEEGMIFLWQMPHLP